MADIAILVAEEYERRMRQTATDSRSSSSVEFDWFKNFPAKIAIGVNEKKIESLMKKFEAKSEFSLAISHGFFSA